MLNSISWQQYATAVILVSVAWYAYVGLRYYQSEILALLKIKPTSDWPEVASSHEVMGQMRPEPGTGLSEPEELVFGRSTPDDISDQTWPKGPGDELLAEARVLISAFAASDDKPSFLALLRILISKYEVFADEISLPQIINVLQTNKLPFTITADEWPQTFAA